MIIKLDDQTQEIQDQVLDLLTELGVETRRDETVLNEFCTITKAKELLQYKSNHSVYNIIKRDGLKVFTPTHMSVSLIKVSDIT